MSMNQPVISGVYLWSIHMQPLKDVAPELEIFALNFCMHQINKI